MLGKFPLALSACTIKDCYAPSLRSVTTALTFNSVLSLHLPSQTQIRTSLRATLVLDYWRLVTLILCFCFSYEKQHFAKLLTGRALRLQCSLQPCQNPLFKEKAVFFHSSKCFCKVSSSEKTNKPSYFEHLLSIFKYLLY